MYLPSAHSGEYIQHTGYDSCHARASKVKEEAMIERFNAPGLSQPPGYSHVVVASGRGHFSSAGAVPLDAEGNLVGAGDLHAQARQTGLSCCLTIFCIGLMGTSVA